MQRIILESRSLRFKHDYLYILTSKTELCFIMEQARKEGQALIKQKDGYSFLIKPVPGTEFPFDVKGVDLSLSADEIVDVVCEIRER